MLRSKSMRLVRMSKVIARMLFNVVCAGAVVCMSACADTNKQAAAPAAALTNQPSSASIAAAVSNAQRLVYLDFQCVDMCTVLQWLAEFTGDDIIADPGVRGAVTIVNPQPTSPDRAREIIFAVLQSKGFTAVRQVLPGGQRAVIKIVPKDGAARKPKSSVRPPLRPDATTTKEQ